MSNSPSIVWAARVVLLVFGVWTAGIVWEHRYTGFIDLALAGGWGAQVFVDLVIALVIVLFWLVGDARRNGRSPWGYVVTTFFLGSIGPLLYLSLGSPREGASPPGA